MKTLLFLPILGTLAILSASCTKELKYSKDEIFDKAKRADPSVTLILPKSISEGISCSDYTQGCLGGHVVKVKDLEFIAVEFESEKDAIYAAKKVRGYYTRNWLLDDVAGEATLEKFVTKALEAKKP